MKLPYGFYIAADGNIAVDQEKANVVQRIYRQYLSGMSLGGITDFLYERYPLSERKSPLDTAGD